MPFELYQPTTLQLAQDPVSGYDPAAANRLGASQFTRGWNAADLSDAADTAWANANEAYRQGDAMRAMTLEAQAKDLKAQAQQWAPRVQNFTDIHGFGDALDWAGGAMGNLRTSVPPAMGSLAGAGLGAAGALLTRGAISPAMGAKWGAGLGAAYPAYTMEANEAYGNAMEDPQIRATRSMQDIANTSRVKGGINGLLESVVPYSLATSIAGIGAKAAGKGLLSSVAKGAGIGALEEGLTEGAQSLVGQGAQNTLLGKPVNDFDYKQAFNEAAAGAVAGGAMGGVTGAAERAHGTQDDTPKDTRTLGDRFIDAIPKAAGTLATAKAKLDGKLQAGDDHTARLAAALELATNPDRSHEQVGRLSPEEQAITDNGELVATKTKQADEVAAKIFEGNYAPEIKAAAQAYAHHRDPALFGNELRAAKAEVQRQVDTNTIVRELQGELTGKKSSKMRPVLTDDQGELEGRDSLDDTVVDDQGNLVAGVNRWGRPESFNYDSLQRKAGVEAAQKANTTEAPSSAWGSTFEKAQVRRERLSTAETTRQSSAEQQRIADANKLDTLAAIWQRQGVDQKLIQATSVIGNPKDRRAAVALMGWIQRGFKGADGQVVVPERTIADLGKHAEPLVRQAIGLAEDEGLVPKYLGVTDLVLARVKNIVEEQNNDERFLISRILPTARHRLGIGNISPDGLAHEDQRALADLGDVLKQIAVHGIGEGVRKRGEKAQPATAPGPMKQLLEQTFGPNLTEVMHHFWEKAKANEKIPSALGQVETSYRDEEGERVGADEVVESGEEGSGEAQRNAREIKPTSRQSYKPRNKESEYFDLRNGMQRLQFDQMTSEQTKADDHLQRTVQKVGIVERELEKAAEAKGVSVEDLPRQTHDKVVREVLSKYYPKMRHVGSLSKSASPITRRIHEEDKARYERAVKSHTAQLNRRYVAMRVVEEQASSVDTEFGAADVAELHLKNRDLRTASPAQGTLVFEREDAKKPFITSAPALMRKMYQVKDGTTERATRFSGSAQSNLELLLDGLVSLRSALGMSRADGQPLRIGYPTNGKIVWLEDQWAPKGKSVQLENGQTVWQRDEVPGSDNQRRLIAAQLPSELLIIDRRADGQKFTVGMGLAEAREARQRKNERSVWRIDAAENDDERLVAIEEFLDRHVLDGKIVQPDLHGEYPRGAVQALRGKTKRQLAESALERGEIEEAYAILDSRGADQPDAREVHEITSPYEMMNTLLLQAWLPKTVEVTDKKGFERKGLQQQGYLLDSKVRGKIFDLWKEWKKAGRAKPEALLDEVFGLFTSLYPKYTVETHHAPYAGPDRTMSENTDAGDIDSPAREWGSLKYDPEQSVGSDEHKTALKRDDQTGMAEPKEMAGYALTGTTAKGGKAEPAAALKTGQVPRHEHRNPIIEARDWAFERLRVGLGKMLEAIEKLAPSKFGNLHAGLKQIAAMSPVGVKSVFDENGDTLNFSQAQAIVTRAQKALTALEAKMKGEKVETGTKKHSRMSTQIHNDLGKEGIAATHDSPIRHEGKFNWREHLLKGEGHAAFGAGTYLSTADGVHKNYKNSFTAEVQGGRFLTDISANQDVRDWLLEFSQSLRTNGVTDPVEVKQSIIDELREQMREYNEGSSEKEAYADAYFRAQGMIASDFKLGDGTASPTYHVTVKAKPDEILDWDKPIREQAEPVKKAIQGLKVEVNDEDDVFGVQSTRTITLRNLVGVRNESATGREVYVALERELGSQAKASDTLQSLGIVGHRYAAAGGKEAQFPNYVIFDDSRIETNAVSFSKQGANTQRTGEGRNQASDAEQAKALDELERVLGDTVDVDLKPMLEDGSSGTWTKRATKNLIELALNGDVVSTAYHESLHEFFDILTNHGAENVKAALLRVATNPMMIRRLERLLNGHPEAQQQVRESPEEALAFMYQFWRADPQGFKLGPETTGWFERIKRMITRLLGKISQEVKDAQHAEEILSYFAGGLVADPANREAVVQALIKTTEDHEAALKEVGKTAMMLTNTFGKLVFSAEAMMDATKNKYMVGIARLFNQKYGEAMGAEQSYFDAVRQNTNRWMNDLESILLKYTKEDIELARQAMASNVPVTDPAAKAIVEAIQGENGFNARIWEFLKPYKLKRLEDGKWVDVQRRNNYFTQVWDMDAVQKNSDAFKADLMRLHMPHLESLARVANQEVALSHSAGKNTASDNELKKAAEDQAIITPDMIADAIVVRILNTGKVDLEETESNVGMSPMASAVNRRALDWLDGPAFDKYKSHDVAEIMTTYVRTMIKRAEYQKRFGPGGEQLRAELDKAFVYELGGDKLVEQAQEALPGEIASWNEMIAQALSPAARMAAGPRPTLRSVGQDLHAKAVGEKKAREALLAAGKKLDPSVKAIMAMEGTLGNDISPGARALGSMLTTYQTFRLLSTMVFTSANDILGPVVNGGEMKDAWDALVRGVREIRLRWSDKKSQDTEARRAEAWGTVDAGSYLDALGQTWGSVYMTGRAKRMNDAFFKWTGMEGWNRAMRIQASSVAERLIVQMAKHGIDRSDEAAVARLERLFGEGAKTESIALDPDGNLDIQDAKNRAAMTRFVIDSVVTPNAAMRPIWGSDPHYQVVMHLKNYTYTFHRTMMNGAIKQASLGNYRPALVLLLSYTPVMIAAGAVKEMLIPGDEPPWMKGGLDSYLSYGWSKAGVLGVPQMIDATVRDGWVPRDYGFAALDLAGPTVSQLRQATFNNPIKTALAALPGGNLLQRLGPE